MKIRDKKCLSISGGLLSALMVAGVLSVSVLPQNAHAYCNYKGEPKWLDSWLFHDGRWGAGGPQYSSTCDGDNIYKGTIKDIKEDQRYVQVRLASRLDMSNEFIHVYTGTYREYTMWGKWYMRLCRSDAPRAVSRDDNRCSKVVWATT